MLTQERLKELLHYDPETGVFTWIAKSSKHSHIAVGDIAGSIEVKGYRVIHVDGKIQKAHRLAWLYVTGRWPKGDIDHINHDGTYNAWKNLREVTHAVNGRNKSKHSNNTSGHTGVTWRERSKRWEARVTVDGKRKHVGTFTSLEAAASAYRAAVETLGYHENHGLDLGAA
jgi:hypothetical protein